VTDPLPPFLGDVIARIEVPATDREPSDLPADVTGSLADLLSWWRALTTASRPTPAEICTAPDGLDVVEALRIGLDAADRSVDSGATILVPRVDPRHDVAARTVISLLTRKEASRVLPQPDGTSDRDWMAACAAVRDRAADVTEHRGAPVDLLAALDAAGIAVTVGVLLGAAARRTPCLVDGTDELAAALVADRLCFRAKGWWRSASDSPDPGRAAAIDRMDLAAGLPLMLTDDRGLGAAASLALLDLLTDGGRR
jgi:nicotinate-nucleotide--dimethylbenzimidazole phosphoribosyltransferase